MAFSLLVSRNGTCKTWSITVDIDWSQFTACEQGVGISMATVNTEIYDVRLWNDLYCVGWGVKLYSIQSNLYYCRTHRLFSNFRRRQIKSSLVRATPKPPGSLKMGGKPQAGSYIFTVVGGTYIGGVRDYRARLGGGRTKHDCMGGRRRDAASGWHAQRQCMIVDLVVSSIPCHRRDAWLFDVVFVQRRWLADLYWACVNDDETLCQRTLASCQLYAVWRSAISTQRNSISPHVFFILISSTPL